MLNNTKDILTLKELQELLHIGKNTALRLVQSGEIEAFRVENSKRRYYPIFKKTIMPLYTYNTHLSPTDLRTA